MEFKITIGYIISLKEKGEGGKRKMEREGEREENGTRIHYVKQNNPGSERQISFFLTCAESRFKKKKKT